MGTFDLSGQVSGPAIDSFLQNLLWERTIKHKNGENMEIFRLKGVLSVAGDDRRVLVQAVHELYDKQSTTPWGDSNHINRMVFIGKNLDKSVLYSQFEKCRVESS